MPTDESLRHIQGLLNQRRERIEASRKAAERRRRRDAQAAREAEQARAEAERAELARRVLAESGRTPTGEIVEYRTVSTLYMYKTEALERARKLGEVVKLRDGRRGLIVERKVKFTPWPDAASLCWHDQIHDEAHWDFIYQCAVVEPTEEEREADAAAEAERADAAALHKLITDAHHSGDASAGWSVIPADERVASISRASGTVQRFANGTLILTTQGVVVWQHPGYYDDWLRTEIRWPADSDIAERARSLIEQGPRTRLYFDQLTHEYYVRVEDAPSAPAPDEPMPEDSSGTQQQSTEAAQPGSSESRSIPEPASSAAREALRMIADEVDPESDLVARLATAVRHDDDVVEEYEDEDQILSAKSRVFTYLNKHTFTLADGEVVALWEVVDGWSTFYEDADANEMPTVYLDEEAARVRYEELVADHQTNPPRADHPEFPHGYDDMIGVEFDKF